MKFIIKDSEHIEKTKAKREKRTRVESQTPLLKQSLSRNNYRVYQLVRLKEILVAVVRVALRMRTQNQPDHSAETLVSLACPLVNLTLSSLARLTMASLKKTEIKMLSECVLDGVLPLEGRDVLGNLTAVSSVVHEEQFNFCFISDEELLEPGGEHVSSLIILLSSDLWSSDLSSETTSGAAIHTSWFSPRFLKTRTKLISVCIRQTCSELLA